ncbi:EpsG family protein [Flavobacterium sp. 2]|uniref:EpsG family protein n=1 Tax=Flavobacterium sp. 2 TaxID=308053 RepID=UPI000C197D8E|nr:EpsG family protein [Flavobacterium sp. 2]PIF59333.1 EpsG-like putative glucosyltransferase [Flavobacterium sp. 2]
MKWKKTDLLNLGVFVISPFLAIPTILVGVVNKSKFSLQLLVLLFGVVSYIYIPHLSNDRARYFELYEDFKDGTFFELFAYLMLTGQDFILQSMFYLASQINLAPQFVFAFTTIVTMSLVLLVFYKITNKEETNVEQRFLAILLVCCAVPYVDLFSGTRFMFATSFVLIGFYIGIVERKFLAVFLLIIAAAIHFSTLVFLPVFLILFIFPNANKIYKMFFLVSLIFMFLPQEILNSAFNMIGMSGGLGMKKEAYLEGEDFIKKGLEESYILRISSFLNLIWISCNYMYLLLTKNRDSLLRNIVLFTAATINLFYSVPTIFYRYSVVLKFLFVFLLIFELYKYKQKTIIYFFHIILACVLFFEIISALPNIMATFSKKGNLFLITILTADPLRSKDFLE